MRVKRKGKYNFDVAWHQNHSALIVPKAAEAALVRGVDITEFITNHGDMFDFFLRTKVPRSSQLFHGDEKVANIVRYYISRGGKPLEKMSPPTGPLGQYKRANKLTDGYYREVMEEIGLNVWDERIHTKNKSKYDDRRIGVNSGWLVTLCNQVPESLTDINLDWYIQETEKLVKPLTDV